MTDQEKRSTAFGNKLSPWSDEAFVRAFCEGHLWMMWVMRCICGRIVANAENVIDLPREVICACGDHVLFHTDKVEAWFAPKEPATSHDAVDPVNRGTTDRPRATERSTAPTPAQLDGQRSPVEWNEVTGVMHRAHIAIRRLICADVPGPDSEQEYCWWCHADINGKTGPAQTHAAQCQRVEAEKAQAQLMYLLLDPEDRATAQLDGQQTTAEE